MEPEAKEADETVIDGLLFVARTIYESETRYEDYLDAGSRTPRL